MLPAIGKARGTESSLAERVARSSDPGTAAERR